MQEVTDDSLVNELLNEVNELLNELVGVPFVEFLVQTNSFFKS